MRIMSNTIVQTVIPIVLLIVAGLLSRRMGVLKSGDERVFSAYVYYFALPALFFINIAEIGFTSEILIFMFAGIVPIFVVLTVYAVIYSVFRFSKNTLYLMILSTIFGSLAFFGIPFVTLAFPTQEHLATLSAASIAVVSVPISLLILELYKLESSAKWERMKHIAMRLSKNPLIISILLGILISIIGIEIPAPISNPLHMLGSTTSAVAIFFHKERLQA